MEREDKQAVLDIWLENKIGEISSTSYKKVRSSVISRRVDLLTPCELLIRELILKYRRTYGEWPTALKGEFN